MRNPALMTVGIVVAIGAAFAVPAMSDGPANYRSSADTSAYLLGDEDHGEYVQRQTDGDVSRDLTARDHAYGYENGVAGTASPSHAYVAEGNYDRDRYMAPSGSSLTMASIAEESIDVQSRRLPNGSPVAVHGMVRTISGKNMMIQRGNTEVHARLPGMIAEIRRGDDVTVYGRLASRGDTIAVRTDAVLVMTGADEGRLFLAPSKLESVNKRGTTTLSRGEARNTLDHYRYNFTPL
jgi:hypothetical protein